MPFRTVAAAWKSMEEYIFDNAVLAMRVRSERRFDGAPGVAAIKEETSRGLQGLA